MSRVERKMGKYRKLFLEIGLQGALKQLRFGNPKYPKKIYLDGVQLQDNFQEHISEGQKH